IQEGYSYGYPQSCVGAHVSASPNHQTLRRTPLATRFAVAAFGALGYECDVRGLPSAEKQAIREQIALYKKWREVMQFGDFYRITEGNLHRWTCVSPDKSRAVVLLLQELTEANVQAHRLQLRGLDPDKTYRLYNIPGRVDVRTFGSLINTVTPVHVRQDSVLHNVIAKQVKMSGETENVTATGSVLMHTGVMLSPAFSGSGFNEKVRIFPDFAARLYFLEAEKNDA
ncbi:MAG: alpha-galactosidase, partial [Ruminococcus sp.]|nr:alpha-galactosidase [Ruminococcus sp.]